MGKFNTKRQLGVWGALMSGLLLLAAVAANSVSTPAKDAQKYECSSSCYSNLRWCLMQGKSQSYCYDQYQSCLFYCGGGGSISGAQAQ